MDYKYTRLYDSTKNLDGNKVFYEKHPVKYTDNLKINILNRPQSTKHFSVI